MTEIFDFLWGFVVKFEKGIFFKRRVQIALISCNSMINVGEISPILRFLKAKWQFPPKFLPVNMTFL